MPADLGRDSYSYTSIWNIHCQEPTRLGTETSLGACPRRLASCGLPLAALPDLRGQGSWHSRGSGVLPQLQGLRPSRARVVSIA